MSTTSDPTPETPADEELVAYLDGELQPEACRRIEARLAADAGYRRQLRGLDQAWEALDVLPAARADEDFTRTTMEMVTVAAESELARQARHVQAFGRYRMWWIVGAGIAASIAGFVVARAFQSRAEAAFLAELPLIRQADSLSQIEDIEFLRRLSTSVPFEQMASDDASLEEEMVNAAWSSAPKPEDRQMWLEALSQDDKAELLARAKRFRALPGKERNRLRQLQRAIEDADDSEQLQRTLAAYGQWLSRLTLGEQEELKEALQGLSPNEQINRVRRYVRQANQRASRRLSSEDAEKLRRAVLQFAAEQRPGMSRDLQRRGWREGEQRFNEPRGALMILNRELQSDDSARVLRERIVSHLSPEAQSHLESLRPWARRAQLWQWVRDSLKPDWGPDELERFFVNSLDNNQRERLLNLPPSEMRSELERLYVASEFGIRGLGNPAAGPPNSPPPDGHEFRPGTDGRDRPGAPPPRFREDDRFDRGPGGPPHSPRSEDRNGRRPPPLRPGPPRAGIERP